jgi:prepilin peptidase CpaA
MESVIYWLLIAVLTVAAVHDLQFRKIPNVLTFSTISAGIVYHAWSKGFEGFFYSIEGTLLGMAFFIGFYLAGKMGAGDVKLMGAVGSILGPSGVFKAFLFTALVGGIYAIILLMYRGQLIDAVKRIVLTLKLSFLARRPTSVSDGGASPVLCYGLAIWIGTSLSMVF